MIDVQEIRYDIAEGTNVLSTQSDSIDDESYFALLDISNDWIAKKRPESFVKFMNNIVETIGVIDDDGGHTIVDNVAPSSRRRLFDSGSVSVWELTIDEDVDDMPFLLTRSVPHKSGIQKKINAQLFSSSCHFG